MNRSLLRFVFPLGILAILTGSFFLQARPVAARSPFEPVRQGPDLSKAIIHLTDLPAGFQPLEGRQLSSMQGLLETFQSTLSKTSNATLQNFTGYNVVDPQNLQFIVSGLIAPLSTADQAAIDRELSDTEGLNEALQSGAFTGKISKLGGSENFGDLSIGITMTISSGSVTLRMDYIVIRRQTVLEEIAVMYLDGKQPAISALNVARILDDRVAAVVGGGAGNTFRAQSLLVPELTTHIPTPLDISTQPGVIGANLFLAALMMLPFAIAAEFFTRILAEHEATLRKKIKPLEWIARWQHRLEQGVGSRLGRPVLQDVAKLAGVMFFYGLVFSLLERNWNPFSLSGLMLFGQMTVAYGVVGIADDIMQWRAVRRWGLAADLTVRPTNVLLAAVSTATSRLFSLVPGLMFGTPEALSMDEAALDADKRNRLLKISAATFLVIGAVFWIPTVATGLLQRLPLPAALADLIGGLEASLLVIFAVALENTFVRMLGFPGGFGQALKRKNRWLWLGGLAAVTFLFFHTLINPRGELANAIQEGNVLVLMIAAGAFLLVSFGLWLFLGRKGGDGVSEESRVLAAASTAPGRTMESAHSVILSQIVSRATQTAAPPVAEMRTEVISGETKPCPSCGESIKAEARICRFCRATFEVTAKGYCVNCHKVVLVDEGRCRKCGHAAVDIHFESKMLTAPAKQPALKPQSALIPEPAVGSASAPADTKPCPVCGKIIKSEAKICRFCRTRFDVPPASPATPPQAVPKTARTIAENSSPYGPQRCPKCSGSLKESEGSPVSPYINTYRCTDCGWMGFRCGQTGCPGYLKPEEIGFPGTVRYNCVRCGWTGTGPRVGF
jgi:hypothetical protein